MSIERITLKPYYRSQTFSCVLILKKKRTKLNEWSTAKRMEIVKDPLISYRNSNYTALLNKGKWKWCILFVFIAQICCICRMRFVYHLKISHRPSTHDSTLAEQSRSVEQVSPTTWMKDSVTFDNEERKIYESFISPPESLK